MSPIRARATVAGTAFAAALVLAVPGPAAAAPAPGPEGGPRAAVAPTVEEARLSLAVPQEILRRSGFAPVAPEFGRALQRAGSYGQARRVVDRHASELWERAVDRAQGRGPALGDLSRDDDRPLYWARLGMTRELRQWQPSFPLTGERRAALLAGLERSSRGQDSMDFPERGRGDGHRGKALKRVVVTGFDPFTLDRDIRISNPSGATALALDGTVIRTAGGPAVVQAAVFPVRWQDFADGTVERTLRERLPEADLFTTVSQGRPGRFDIERHNGAWRGGFPDNENVSRTETVPVADPATQPQWTRSTLPVAAITAAPTGRFPVLDNTSVQEIPAGGSTPVVSPGGPTPGSVARQGGGGNYLSNEIAYRATLLRDRLGLDTPGGHVHTPVLEFGAGNTTEITDPAFLKNRQDIVGQVREIIEVAAGA
ncbi:pyroglutamyl-peptidase I family protein [Streptomyces yaizuensis]|uniref:Pyroglutamyl peptidase n=1 Tax=Streptomyces yaizuensis TaxID=2989713 RepID=A0ABQ5NU06_9ACTN|nr:pyroglutamyl peptidase [Streptomyces sp. YSPA8]GLF93854.1 pyroglutamyl peptidase [Streptomyces sp. YSPA8]